ncbi:hypothetical protein ACTWPB_11030 [Nocardia sp. IBHARD005]|uniref:hypothetical protein n=1 Tax=Nocardia sp. IBHARD005 TaxID=3457765 RepID=UPI004058E142
MGELMRPQWSSERESDADPVVEAAVRDLMGAVDDLRTACIRIDNFDMQAYFAEPTEVTDDFMWILAERPGASAELVSYALFVRDRGYQWSDIEKFARPVPPEIAELKSSDRFIWKWTPESEASHSDPPHEVWRGSNAVGPSDWDDDFDQTPDSWLE